MRLRSPWKMAVVLFIAAACGAPEAPEEPHVSGPPNVVVAEGEADLPPDPTGPGALTVDGWGELRIGMTRAEAEAVVGGPANPDLVGGPEPEICDEFRPARSPAGMLLMIERDTLTRITLVRGSTLRTTAGIAVGAGEDDVVASHPDGAEVGPHKYLPSPAAYVTVRGVGPHGRGYVYETDTDRRVTHIHAGGPSIHYVEGCL